MLLWSLLALVLIAGGAAYAWVRSHRAQLELGVGYAARVGCGCRYMGGRALADCHKDFEPGMEPIRLSENAATRTITASVPLIASRSARYDPVLGCQPKPFASTPLAVRH
ncbi:hypothetical protein [Sphingomonas oligophenolica]|uniref:hypothetical protein n=1 Tax=Sphingomonas oligophenolica TaxID=301154 RepID=UPI0019D59F5D|nr:hypothetical protein [Sphingomonas oligophenolica]